MVTRVPELGKNRRLALRHMLRVPIRFHVRRMSDISEHDCESENLSRRGVFFQTDVRLTEGAIVDLLLEMPEEVTEVPAATWLCTGRVVRVVSKTVPDGPEGVAVKFDFYEISRSATRHWAVGSAMRGPMIPRDESQTGLAA